MAEKIKKIKLLFVNQTLDIGGAEVFHTDLLSSLQKQHVDIRAYVSEPRYVNMLLEKKIQTQKIPVILDIVGNWKGLFKAFLLFPAAFLYYWTILAKNRNADLVLLSSFTEKFLVSPIAFFYRLPVLWIEFGPVHPLLKKFFGLPNIFYKMVSFIPQKVIVPSLHTQKSLIEHQNVFARKIVVIPCGRDITADQVRMLSQQKIVKNTILCLSRMEKGKGQDLLIKAFSMTRKENPNAMLQISGMSSWQTELSSLVKKLGLEDSVHFLGTVQDPLVCIARSQVCVFPSVWELEGFGLVMIEAMALGKPVVAFKVGPTSEIIRDQENGFLVEKENVTQLADKLLKVLKQTKEIQIISAQAKNDFYHLFQIEKVSKKYMDIFLRIKRST